MPNSFDDSLWNFWCLRDDFGEGNGTPLQYSCLENPGRRSLVGCSPWGRYESGTTERLHIHFSLSCIGDGNGNPLRCSCLENLRDGGAWWAPVYGATQSQTQLKRLSSSSSSSVTPCGFCFYFLIKKNIEVKLIYHVWCTAK